MKKYIHYCWFGGKPLPKLAEKCLNSWKKYLPDFEIKRWDESNVDLEECPFIKDAYASKKWAFVADYVRSKVMYEMGGIYFDTDMEVLKPVDYLFKDESFIGVEDSGYIACGVWYEKNKGSKLSKYLLDFYKKQKKFDPETVYDFTIPKLITSFYEKYGFDIEKKETQVLSCGTVVYPREYFYPISMDRQDNIYTDNTCMIHYYDASWIPDFNKKSLNNIRRYGKTGTKIYNVTKKIAKKILFPVVMVRENKRKKQNIITINNNFDSAISKLSKKDYIALCNEKWIGVRNATQELFENTIVITENINTYDHIVEKILESNKHLIIFSGFYYEWIRIIKKVKEKNPKVKIKILWHGSNAMNVEEYDWKVLKTIFELLENKLIESIGFVKKTMYDLYKELGYNVEFVMNTIHIDSYKELGSKKENKNIKIGVYASGDRWVKNFYNQLAGAALVKNSVADIVPISEKAKSFCKILKLNVTGDGLLSRGELLNRLSKNDINLYITFVECAPIIPLESLELGVPCITANNHHYWQNTELEKYLVLDKCEDPKAIADRIELCLKNKDKIIKLYNEWKKEYDLECEKNNKKFIEGDKKNEKN